MINVYILFVLKKKVWWKIESSTEMYYAITSYEFYMSNIM